MQKCVRLQTKEKNLLQHSQLAQLRHSGFPMLVNEGLRLRSEAAGGSPLGQESKPPELCNACLTSEEATTAPRQSQYGPPLAMRWSTIMANRAPFTPHYAGITHALKVASAGTSNPSDSLALNIDMAEWRFWSWYLDGWLSAPCRLRPPLLALHPFKNFHLLPVQGHTPAATRPSLPPPCAAGRPAFCQALAESARAIP